MLPRQESFIKQLIASTVHAYNTVMSDYTKNTGGGDGDDAAVVVWNEQDEVEIVNYDYKIKNSVYLTVVHMFNKLYDFLLVVVKDGVPTEFQIDDSRTEITSPISSRQKSKDSLSVDDTQYGKTMEKTFNAVMKYFGTANNGSVSNGHNLQKYDDLVLRMDHIQMSIKNFEDGISVLNEKKRKEKKN